MKKIALIIMMFPLFLAACQKDEADFGKALPGVWEMVESEGAAPSAGLSIWLVFEDGNFEIYQRASVSERYKLYKGTYTISGSTLCGSYSDGTPWACDYRLRLEEKMLVMEALAGSGVWKYRKSALPSGLEILSE
ncbi:MAG: lipocalin family protein [Bacteroidales bacterium]|nr:lipocalin family protein [Bacteroidales bacterium]